MELQCGCIEIGQDHGVLNQGETEEGRLSFSGLDCACRDTEQHASK